MIYIGLLIFKTEGGWLAYDVTAAKDRLIAFAAEVSRGISKVEEKINNIIVSTYDQDIKVKRKLTCKHYTHFLPVIQVVSCPCCLHTCSEEVADL